MSNLKMITFEKREQSNKERHLSDAVKHVEELQSFLASVNRQGDLWEIFNDIAMFVGSCMRESIEGKGYERYYNKYDENGRIIKEAEKRHER